MSVFSRFAGTHLTITPAECSKCRLCEESCPYDAILPSNTEQTAETPEKSRKRFILYFLFIPLFALAGGYLFKNLSPALSGVNSTVRLAREIRYEKESGIKAVTKSALAFKEAGQTEADLFAQEEYIINRFRKMSPWAGIFLGVSLGIGMVALSIRSRRTEYKPDQGKCYSCGRCFKYCPIKVKSNNEA